MYILRLRSYTANKWHALEISNMRIVQKKRPDIAPLKSGKKWGIEVFPVGEPILVQYTPGKKTACNILGKASRYPPPFFFFI